MTGSARDFENVMTISLQPSWRNHGGIIAISVSNMAMNHSAAKGQTKNESSKPALFGLPWVDWLS